MNKWQLNNMKYSGSKSENPETVFNLIGDFSSLTALEDAMRADWEARKLLIKYLFCYRINHCLYLDLGLTGADYKKNPEPLRLDLSQDVYEIRFMDGESCLPLPQEAIDWINNLCSTYNNCQEERNEEV